MPVIDQIPAIDAAVSRMDRRINRATATIEKLSERVKLLLNRIERVRTYRRTLGREKSRIATFKLEL